jgi:uncharacterized membrane protein
MLHCWAASDRLTRVVYVAMFVQFFHIVAGIAWFGSSIFIMAVMVPALRRVSAAGRDEYVKALEVTSKRFFPIAGGLTVLLGIVRGLLFGLDLNSAYGKTYVAAAVLGVGLLVYGAVVTGGNVQRMAAAAAGPEQSAALERVARFGRFELAGFFVLLALMIAMRFGY